MIIPAERGLWYVAQWDPEEPVDERHITAYRVVAHFIEIQDPENLTSPFSVLTDVLVEPGDSYEQPTELAGEWSVHRYALIRADTETDAIRFGVAKFKYHDLQAANARTSTGDAGEQAKTGTT